MEIDEEKVDEVVLALLYLTTFKDIPRCRAGKVTVGMSSIDFIRRVTFRIPRRTQDLFCWLRKVCSGPAICSRNTTRSSDPVGSEPDSDGSAF